MFWRWLFELKMYACMEVWFLRSQNTLTNGSRFYTNAYHTKIPKTSNLQVFSGCWEMFLHSKRHKCWLKKSLNEKLTIKLIVNFPCILSNSSTGCMKLTLEIHRYISPRVYMNLREASSWKRPQTKHISGVGVGISGSRDIVKFNFTPKKTSWYETTPENIAN